MSHADKHYAYSETAPGRAWRNKMTMSWRPRGKSSETKLDIGAECAADLSPFVRGRRQNRAERMEFATGRIVGVMAS